MFVLIVGGGKVGYYLAKTLVPEKHRLILIEEDADLCVKIAGELSDLGVSVIHGDGTDIQFLKDAGIEKADILIAVTGYDENNLVACELAKNYFQVPRTIARVNNPKNIHVFKQLGVDSAVSSTALIADLLEQEVDWACVNSMLALKTGSLRVKEMPVGALSHAAGKKVADLEMPDGAILIAVIHDRKAVTPHGQTQLAAGDHIIAMADQESFAPLQAYFAGEARRRP